MPRAPQELNQAGGEIEAILEVVRRADCTWSWDERLLTVVSLLQAWGDEAWRMASWDEHVGKGLKRLKRP